MNSFLHNLHKTLFLVLLISGLVFSQNEVPNPGFENWTTLNPDFWTTFNLTNAENVTPSADAYSGLIAARGEVIDPGVNHFPPNLQSHNGSGAPFAISQGYNFLVGYYKFFPQGDDSLFISCSIHGTGPSAGGKYAEMRIGATTNQWTQFVLPLVEYQSGTIDQASIFVFLENIPSLNVGSYFLVDDLQLVMTITGVEDYQDEVPSEFTLHQNYPNPFNPSTTIKYNLPKAADVELTIYNTLGQKIVELVNQYESAGEKSVKWDGKDAADQSVSSGVYIYRIKADDLSASQKMLLTQ